MHLDYKLLGSSFWKQVSYEYVNISVWSSWLPYSFFQDVCWHNVWKACALELTPLLLGLTGGFLYLFFFYFQSLFDFLGYYLDPALSTEFHYEILLNFSPTRNYLHLVPGPVLGAWDMSVRTSSSAPARSCLHPALLPFHLFHLPFPAELSLTSELCIGQAGPTWTALWIPTEFYFLLAPGIICPVGLGPGLRVYCLMSVVWIYTCFDGKFSALEGRVHSHYCHYSSHYQEPPRQAFYTHLLSVVFQ